MPYKVPELAELVEIINGLRSAYKNPNALRLSMITLLEKMAADIDSAPETDKRDILLGGLVFVLTDIAKEYSWLSPERSTLYSDISKKLKLSAQNKFNDDQQFMYLGRFYLHLAKQIPRMDITGLYWKSKLDLLNHVEKDLLLLKNREKDRLEALQTTQPVLDAIEKEIDQFCDAYTAEYNNRRFFKDPSRMELVQFIKFIREACRETITRDQEQQSEDAYLRSCYIRLGLIMYVLKVISDEYGFFKPDGNRYLGKYNGSSLYKMCEKALNIRQLTDLTCDQKMAWLVVLNAYVLEISNQTEKYKDNPAFLKLQTHRNKLEHICTHKSELHNQPGWAMWGATTAVSNVASLAAGQAISAAVVEAAGVGTVMTTAGVVVGLASGPAGWLALGAATIIMSQALRTAIPIAGGWAASYLIDWIGQTTSDATRHIIRHTLSNNKPKGYYELVNHPRLSIEEREFIKKWIETVLALPGTVITAEEKKQIRTVLGIEAENDIEFVPHSDLAPVFSARR